LTTAFAALAAAIYGLLSQTGAAVLTHWLYAAAVSLYSTALVFAPSAPGSRATTGSPAIRAAALFAIAGWLGSVLGIGMAQDLHTIPSWLPIAASAPIVFLWVCRKPASFIRKAAKPALLLVLAVAAVRRPSQGARYENQDRSEVEYGREVYLSEGCIHCHSQYVRPNSLDALNWGPSLPAGKALHEKPPLIGNRRQGPDLANIGNRRSTAWNELHLINPRSLVPDSRMPSYAYLFESGDSRGKALAAYLCSLGSDTLEERMRVRNSWCPDVNAHPIGSAGAERLFLAQCAACHGADAKGNGPLSTKLGGRLPRDLTMAEWLFMSRSGTPDEHLLDLARVIKFGIPGSSMPGHETFTDEETLGLSLYVASLAPPRNAL
jgi:cytochrome c oxidase cbb3-type subunit 2